MPEGPVAAESEHAEAAAISLNPNLKPQSGQVHMGAAQLISISAFWLASNIHWTILLVILMPHQFAELAGRNQSVVQGRTLGIGAIFPLLVPLLIGPLSDRCMSRLGRRRPFLIWGVAVNVLGLLLMLFFASRHSYLGFFFGFIAVQLGNNIATGAYNGVIPDVVLPSQRGSASGYFGMMTQIGSAIGVISGVLFLWDQKRAVLVSYAIIIISLVLCLIWTCFALHEKPLDERPEPIDWMAFVKGLWIDPRKYPDFAWVWITRALVMFGFYMIPQNVQYYLRDVIHVDNPEAKGGEVFLIILLAATLTGVFGGWLSDRVGRKVIVYWATGLMAFAAPLLVACQNLSQAVGAGLIFGLGYGAYISVDWALGTDVLPNKEEAGKDMAVWHIAMVGPQSIAAFVAGSLLAAYGSSTVIVKGQEVTHYPLAGYATIFGIAAVALALGAIFLRNVRGAR